LELSEGDMRRALNILQAAHSANDFIHKDTIYHTTGAPLPADIEKIVEWLFNAEFSEATASIFC
jgi:replication factor C subunit 3/5